jgi:glycosyltransferase involved in cell wall biosynthesis
MHICIVYDCLFPWTVGGAERWYRSLAERLVADGHEVTYLTRRQWEPDVPPVVPGVKIIAVSPNEPLYGDDGNRRIGEAIRFGRGVLRHLLRHGGRYDVVHAASFPYFSVLAAGAASRRWRFPLVVDWFELWSARYWRGYVGRVSGTVGLLVQWLCAQVPQRAFCFSELHARRLRAQRLRGSLTVLRGLYVGELSRAAPEPADDVVVFAGRHIAEKRAPAVVPAIARARRELPSLGGLVLGDGPQRPAVLDAIVHDGLQEEVRAPGFVGADAVDQAMRRALCLLLPSRREGYGMVVIEAASRGTPSIVVREEDNAAVELVADGVNGVVAESADPEDLGAAIVEVHRGGDALRRSTAAWFAEHAQELALETSLERVAEAYRARA